MTDDYHFTKDPATLIEARLTKDEAEAIASYRAAREQFPDGPMKNLVIVIPIAAEFLVELPEGAEEAIRDIAAASAMDAVRREQDDG